MMIDEPRGERSARRANGQGGKRGARPARDQSPRERPDEPAPHEEDEALRRELCPLIPAAAAVCGVDSSVLRLLCRAIYGPRHDPTRRLWALRLARFAVEQLPPDVHHRLRVTAEQMSSRPIGMDRCRDRAARQRLPTRPTVLVVDDNPTVVGALVAILAGVGYQLRYAADCAAAQREIERQPPTLAIADVLLPEVDGTDGVGLALDLMARRIPLLLLCSIRVNPLDPRLAFLPRTFDADELIAAVGRLLAARN